MDRKDMKTFNQMRAPLIAQSLLMFAAGPKNRDPILGDLQEEYETRFARLSAKAQIWYWREAVWAMPPLMLLRLSAINFIAIAASIGIAFLALIVIGFWDFFIARGVSGSLAASLLNAPTFLIQMVHSLLQLAGMGFCAAVIAFFKFRDDMSFVRNFRRHIGVLVFLLIGPSLLMFLYASASYSSIDRIGWVGFTSLALIIGAYSGSRVRTRNR